MSLVVDQLPPPAKYVLAILIAALALWMRFALTGVLPEQGFPFLTFFPAVLLTAYLTGLGPSLVAALISIASAYLFFTPKSPEQLFGLSTPDAVALGVFAAILAVDCLLVHILLGKSRELQASQRRFYTLAQNSPDVLTRFDRELRHVFVSDAIKGVTGRDPSEFTGLTNRELGMPPALCDVWDASLLRVIHTREPQSLRFDFEGRVFSALLVPERDNNAAEVTHVLCVTREITELAAQQRQLEERNRFKDQFIATVAHELRNPLAAMNSCVGILRMGQPPDQNAGRAVQILERQVKHASKLVDDLMDLSRVRSDKLKVRLVPIDLRDALQGAEETCTAQYEQAGITLHLTVPDRPLPVMGDHPRLVQVFCNLLGNACKFSSRGQAVRVHTDEDGDGYVTSVIDEGAGIPPDMLHKVFEPFAQAQAGIDQRTGLGIGLALVSSIVALHNGTVTASSEGTGRGAQFSVRIPRTTAAQRPG